ncbi:rifin [Plasmodium reichenowi]|uniref:Rifin n=1 Tax=Plasmodium reichenowi TaxID=5854 RepID=A0A060RQD2_PLARE|nr:rifin [Plasmodium reichenowi]
MKVHYINILLFGLPLNILEHNQRNHKSTTHHTPKIHITRLLCECELYSPANYDNDPQMKKVMQQFDDSASQRLREYDERLQEKRKKCKEQCDKEIQKIILKDKLEKELMEKFATLQTDIQSDAIPTCICEKSLSDKVEKNCLLCGSMLSGGIAPTVGLIGSVVIGSLKNAAIKVATDKAIAAGVAKGAIAGAEEGVKVVIEGITREFGVLTLGDQPLISYFTTTPYNNVTYIAEAVHKQFQSTCLSFRGSGGLLGGNLRRPICKWMWKSIPGQGGDSLKDLMKKTVEEVVEVARGAASDKAAEVTTSQTALLKGKNIAEVEAATTPYYTPIIASIIAIEVIVLIMVIIYLILRYKRKKKMKKKLQYIKLLEE